MKSSFIVGMLLIAVLLFASSASAFLSSHPTFSQLVENNTTSGLCGSNYTYLQSLDPSLLAKDLETLEQFIVCTLEYESQFFKNGLGINALTGLSVDGISIDLSTMELGEQRTFSAPSKEGPFLAILAQALIGNPAARHFVQAACDWTCDTDQYIFDLLTLKMDSYDRFDQKYPGYGGFMPWYNISGTDINPTWDWTTSVPSLDNGEWIWSLYATTFALEIAGQDGLAQRYSAKVQKLAKYAAMVFYRGEGRVVTVSSIKDIRAEPTPDNYYGSTGFLNDPYEGELFTLFLDLFGQGINQTDRDALWLMKQEMLQSVEFESPSLPNSITVQRGFWFSSHEQWKVMVLPYRDAPTAAAIFNNAERVRTWNSCDRKIPGMHASINAPDGSYISALGIPNIDFETLSTREVVCPYSVFPTALVDIPVAMSWLAKILLNSPDMQTPYGAAESFDVDENTVAGLLTWDGKMTTMQALMTSIGAESNTGFTDLTRLALQADGVYDRFVTVIEEQYGLKFPSIVGTNVDLCLPSFDKRSKP